MRSTMTNIDRIQLMEELHGDTMRTYQEQAYDYAAYGDNVEYPFLALAEEAGEVMGKLAKFVRKNNCTVNDAILAAVMPTNEKEEVLRTDLIKELGDLRWQLEACLSELGVSTVECEERNLLKLSGRCERGTIVGEGDDR